MDALRKAAAVAAGGISTIDRGIRQQARDAAEKQVSDAEARRRAAALMAPSANTAASTHTGGGAGAGGAAGRSPGPDMMHAAAASSSTPASGRRRPASPGAFGASVEEAGGGATPGGAAALAADVYGGLEELRRATLGTPATPDVGGARGAGGGNGFDISALADMLRIDIASRRALPRGKMRCAAERKRKNHARARARVKGTTLGRESGRRSRAR
jgi:hypothetical protein